MRLLPPHNPRRLFLLVTICIAAPAPFFTSALPSWWFPEGWERGWEHLSSISGARLLGWGFLATVFSLASILTAVERWRVLLAAQGIRLSRRFLTASWFSGVFIGFPVPLHLARDAYRFYDTARTTLGLAPSLAAVLMEKCTAVVSFLLLASLTAPFGFWALGVAPAKLRGGLLVLTIAGIAAALMILLLRPLILRAAAAATPMPDGARNAVEHLVDALLVCASDRRPLVRAIVFGFLAQGFTALSWCCAFLMLRSAGASFVRLAMASPLAFAEPVLGHAIVGAGIRERVCGQFLTGDSMLAKMAAAGVLVWMVTYVFPWILSIVTYAWRAARPRVRRPQEEELGRCYRLSAEEGLVYRGRLVNCALAGAAGGLLGGALFGLAESAWLCHIFLSGAPGLNAYLVELRLFWWAPLVYGIVFSVFGLGVAQVLAFIYLATGRFPRASESLASCLGLTFAAATIVVGRYRYIRDVLDDHHMSLGEIALLLVIALVVFVVIQRLVSLVLGRVNMRKAKAALLAILLWAGLIAAGGGFGAMVREDIPRPQFSAPKIADGPPMLLVVVDTLRADYLSVYNDTSPAQTPHIEAFARDAVVFRNSFAQASWTKPSFATLFTGQYAGVHKTTGKADVLPPEAITLAEVLQEHGYYTQGFPNNRNVFPLYGMDQGFVGYEILEPRFYFGATFSAELLSVYLGLRWVSIALRAPKVHAEHYYRPADDVNRSFLSWLDKNDVPPGVPPFLYLHYMDPHDPYMCANQQDVGFSTIHMGNNPDPEVYLEGVTDAYTDEVEYVDRALGEVFSELKARGLYDGMLIVVTADHGEEFYDHRGWYHGPTLYEELVHIPLIVKLPSHNATGEFPHAGTTNLDIARHIDVAPTFLQQAGAPIPPSMNGIPLFDATGNFANANTLHSHAEIDFLDTIAVSIRTQDWKLIRAKEHNPRGLAPAEFYDMQHDPGEQHNLAGTGEPQQDTLQQALEDLVETMAGLEK